MIQSETSQREKWIDAARGIGIILVLIGHSNGLPALVRKVIYGFHMPFFFILSGYLFHPKEEIDIWTYIRQKFRQFIVPYFVMGLVNLALQAFTEAKTIHGTELLLSTARHFWYLMYSYANSNKMPNCSPLWFLPCLFISSILFFLLYRMCRQKGARNTSILWLCILCSVLYLNSSGITHLPWHLDVAVVGATLMGCGCLLRQRGWLDHFDYSIAIPLLIVGFGVIAANMDNTDVGYVAMSGSRYMNPALFFIGGTFVSYGLLYLIRKYYRLPFHFLEYTGRNTYLFFGFNYAAIALINFIWKNTPDLPGKRPVWYIQTTLVFLLLFVATFLWDNIKKVAQKEPD